MKDFRARKLAIMYNSLSGCYKKSFHNWTLMNVIRSSKPFIMPQYVGKSQQCVFYLFIKSCHANKHLIYLITCSWLLLHMGM